MSDDEEECSNNVKVVDIGTPNYFDWKEFYPEMSVLLDNLDVLRSDLNNIPQVGIFCCIPSIHLKIHCSGLLGLKITFYMVLLMNGQCFRSCTLSQQMILLQANG
jgi:hypothetical protein